MIFSFLLLGTATGCSDDDSNDESDSGAAIDDDDFDDDADDDGDLCDEAKEDGLSGTNGEVYCDLIDIIRSVNISNETKEELLDCLPDLDAASREEILELFADMTSEEIADYLEDPWFFCHLSDGDDDADDDDH